MIDLDDYPLFTADVPVLAGWSGRFGHFWIGPCGGVRSRRDRDEHPLLSDRPAHGLRNSWDLRVFDLRGTTFHHGAQIGGAVGYRWFWVAAGLSILGLSGSATLTLPGMGYAPSFGGAAIAPSVALLLQI